MPCPENIIPPKKGEVRNPKGRGKGVKNRSTLLKKWINISATVTNPITKKEEKGKVEDLIAIALISKAIKGDIIAIKEINDTLYGKIQDKTELTGKDGGLIQINYIIPNENNHKTDPETA